MFEDTSRRTEEKSVMLKKEKEIKGNDIEEKVKNNRRKEQRDVAWVDTQNNGKGTAINERIIGDYETSLFEVLVFLYNSLEGERGEQER